MSDTTEPAIPIRAALPQQAYDDLMSLAKAEIGGLQHTGWRVAYDITEDRQARISAVVTVLDVRGGTLDVGTQVKYAGRWTAGGFVQWTRKD